MKDREGIIGQSLRPSTYIFSPATYNSVSLDRLIVLQPQTQLPTLLHSDVTELRNTDQQNEVTFTAYLPVFNCSQSKI